MLVRGKRAVAVAASFAMGLGLTACGQNLPASVVKKSHVTVAWSGPLTSTNAAALLGRTEANADVAGLTRSQFAVAVDGKVQPDTSFGKVTVTRQKPFTVRYDLTKPSWSDGVPLDAADLLLAWAVQTGGRAGFQTLPTGLAHATHLAKVDEFGRSITLTFDQPVPDWQTALDVAVPAHVVGERALGVGDPMEAKQKVIEAVRDGDSHALALIAKAWNAGFTLKGGSTPDKELIVSSGPYRIDRISRTGSGAQRVELVGNGNYAGALQPKVAEIDLVQTAEAAKLKAVSGSAHVTQIAPTTKNWTTVHDLERRDYNAAPADDGTMWVLALRADRGLFKRPDARAAFLRAVPRSDMLDAAAGPWGSAFTASDVLLTTPNGDGADVIKEDAGFKAKLGSQGDAATERAQAGVPAKTVVCVGYDNRDPFAAHAFSAMVPGLAEGGWAVRDCGRGGFSAGDRKGPWQAMLVRVPVPISVVDLALLWGGTPAANLAGVTNRQRDALIAALGRTGDVYKARALRAQVEKTIVDDAIALPLAMNATVMVTSPHVSGATPRDGAGSLTATAASWSVVPGK